jgi:C_GCAxxG_C_C family probable redox protein
MKRKRLAIDLTERARIVDLSKTHAAAGFLCSESVLLAISDWLGIRSELIPKIATGFGGGVGGCGSLCGAIAGGVMALGLKFGRNDPKQKTVVYDLAAEFLKRFEKEHGHILCRELTGCDLATEAGRKRYNHEKMWETKCRQYIGNAAGMVIDLISQRSS